MINAAGCGAESSPSGGACVPVRGRARRRRPGPGGPPCGGVARGAAPGSGVGGGGGGGGAGFAARPPPQLCRAEYASVTAGRTPGVTDQDLRRSEAWLGNRRRLAGVIRAVVAGPPPQAHRRSRGRGGHLARPRRGAWGRMVQRPSRGVGCCGCGGCGGRLSREVWYLAIVPYSPGHKHQLKDKVRRSKSSLFSCRVKCQECCMGTTIHRNKKNTSVDNFYYSQVGRSEVRLQRPTSTNTTIADHSRRRRKWPPSAPHEALRSAPTRRMDGR